MSDRPGITMTKSTFGDIYVERLDVYPLVEGGRMRVGTREDCEALRDALAEQGPDGEFVIVAAGCRYVYSGAVLR
jgi:hypothetical protein